MDGSSGQGGDGRRRHAWEHPLAGWIPDGLSWPGR